MTEITSISVSLKECSSSEADESNSNLNGSVDYKVIEKDNCKALEINKTDESVNKGVSNIPVSSSMQDQPFTVLRSNKSLSSMSSDYIGNIGNSNAVTSLTAESASFALLSRRESSLENLAEDETCLHNVCVSPFIDVSNPNIVEKPAVIENAVNIPKKIESSRLRRTLSSLLSCCTQKSRRSQYLYKTDLITTPVGDSDTNLTIDKCSNISTHKQATSRSAEGDHISFSCLKLKKFLDIFDESDSPLKRGQQSTKADTNKSMTTTCITRDIDKSDSPSKTMKNTDAFQSENGGANLIRPVLLGTVKPADQGKKCFIIDLDETLVHSSFKMVEKADFKVGVDIEGTVHTVYVLKRPYVDVFLQRMGRIFECVLFTASLAKYADPVTDFLDKWRVFRWRLFRESCVFHRGNYVKDLSMLGRQADQVAILDNSPASYMFHPDNAVQITSWFDDPRDTALLDLIPYFEQLAAAPSVPPFLASVKPPQRATVPISVMLATPTSISLQPVSPHQLQNQQHTSSSPITSVEPCVVASSADHHSDSNSPAVSRTIYLPISSYIGSQIPSSIKSLSMISSKSMPSMYSEDECVSSLGAKFSRSETDLANLSSVVHIKSEANGRAGAGGSGSRGGAEQDAYPQRVFSKSTTNIPTVLTYDDIFPKLVLNSLASRSFPTLLSGDRYKSELTEESQNGLQTISISKKYFLPPRSASFSVQRFPAEKTHRSNSLSEPRVTGIFNSFFTD